jgi:uncharacterized phage protein (TIGR02218 family)
MTSFATLETSVESSRPIELYEVILGSSTYRYTSTEDMITVGSDDYTPETIARSQLELGADAANRTLILTVSSQNVIARQYINVVPGERGLVTIYRYQRDESPAFSTTVQLFKGIIQSVRFHDDGTTAEIAVRSIETALNRTIPRFSYMGMCNHFLFDQGCQANPSLFNFIGPVTSISGSTMTVTGAGASGFDFVGGHARPVGANDFRMVLAQAGDVLTLLLPFSASVVGGNVQIYAGCDHVVDSDCANVFNNVINFGGFGFVPNRNVFQTGL